MITMLVGSRVHQKVVWLELCWVGTTVVKLAVLAEWLVVPSVGMELMMVGK